MKSHPFDAVSTVFGVIFAGIGSLFLLGNDVESLATRFWPAAVVLLGLAMLFSARREEAPAVERPLSPPVREVPPPPSTYQAAASAQPVAADPIVTPAVTPPAQLPETSGPQEAEPSRPSE